MKKFSYSAFPFLAVVLAVMVVMAAEVRFSNAVNCSPAQLSPCLPAIKSSSPPSNDCCVKLREQRPCFCGYVKNPSLRQYVSSPRAREVVKSCGVPFPTC
ncbi:hypothetical protein JCGZ_13009 [Jatropha curcas]|uniref:Bifunctional inhibitor/plant lipid transfer protein/seed storage helical domain-containing protein n=1 Tax=Jatropha curcas TaxID=180498 RepID=A0A067KD74_JATCU|nr:non-specific lipid-transfer protein 2 [Jatropha curcas]KDP32978.1 hypothetical protein JCGZ_13009 [Jatropha curcas]